MTEDGGQRLRNSELGMRNAERKDGELLELGIRTRRRPIGQDYAVAKDAASGPERP